MIVENFSIIPIPLDDVPRSSAGDAPVSANRRTFILRLLSSTDPKTGVVSISNLVEWPEELAAAWHCQNIANVYRSQADQLLDLIRVQLKSLALEHGLPVRYLYGHAIEMYLKAFLRAEGVTEDALRNNRMYGHRLEDLYTECKSRGLTMNSAEAACFDPVLHYLKKGHEEYQFRYFEEAIHTADPDPIKAAAQAIAHAAGAHIGNLLREYRQQAERGGKQVVSLPKKMLTSVGSGLTPDGKVPITIGFGSPPPSA